MRNDDLSHTRLKPNGERLPESDCPACGKRLDAAEAKNTREGSEQRRPEPGDITLCVGCASFLRFNDDYSLRMMTEEEVAALNDDTRIHMLRLRRMIQMVDEREASG